MNDREFLIWIHERFEHVYNENPLYDYMHRLRGIIALTPKENYSGGACNNLEELKQKLDSVQ